MSRRGSDWLTEMLHFAHLTLAASSVTHTFSTLTCGVTFKVIFVIKANSDSIMSRTGSLLPVWSGWGMHSPATEPRCRAGRRELCRPWRSARRQRSLWWGQLHQGAGYPHWWWTHPAVRIQTMSQPVAAKRAYITPGDAKQLWTRMMTVCVCVRVCVLRRTGASWSMR